MNRPVGENAPGEKITIDQGFWIDRTDVAQVVYMRVMNAAQSRYKGADCRVDRVGWT